MKSSIYKSLFESCSQKGGLKNTETFMKLIFNKKEFLHLFSLKTPILLGKKSRRIIYR